MKRFWLVLLSLGLVMAFSASAFAVDVKFSGSYYAAGAYVDKVSVIKDVVPADQSSAFYFQRLRLTTEFVAAPGLSLVTRANILERVWGNTRSNAGTTLDTGSAATRAENENIGFDFAYIDYTSPIGQFKVGYQNDSAWGTVFGDSSTARGKIYYALPIGNFKVAAAITKYNENSLNAINTTTLQADMDNDKYTLGALYATKAWEAGLLYNYFNTASNRTTPDVAGGSYKGKYHSLTPYAKANIGPVAIQAELNYYFGKYRQYDVSGVSDQDVSSLAGFIDAVGTFGPVYVGGTFAYTQGDDINDTSKNRSLSTGGRDWNPCLILWNEDYTYWVDGTTAVNKGNAMSNAFFYQLRAGVRPTAKLDIGMAVAFAQADRDVIANQASKDYGWEIDVTGSYKITNNLSYMLGVGYLIPGDQYKMATSTTSLNNTYLVINKLTLTF